MCLNQEVARCRLLQVRGLGFDQVQRARVREEVGDVEPKRPEVAVPTDDVERVVAIVIRRDPVGRADILAAPEEWSDVLEED